MKAMMPMMMPKKQARRERIMRARVASRWAVEESGMNGGGFLDSPFIHMLVNNFIGNNNQQEG